MADWHFVRDGQQQGPITFQALQAMAQAGQLRAEDPVWTPGMAGWASAGQTAGIFPPGHLPPAPVLPIEYASPQSGPQHSLGDDAATRWLLPVGRSGWAIAAGYLGLFSVIFFPAPLALICSIIAIRDIRKHPNRHGMGRAIFGLVMGLIFTVGLCLMLIFRGRG